MSNQSPERKDSPQAWDDELIGIEDKFRQSWDAIEEVYEKKIQERNYTFLIPLLSLIREMRDLHYDQCLKATYNGNMLMLLRSKPKTINDLAKDLLSGQSALPRYRSSIMIESKALGRSILVMAGIKRRSYSVTISPIALTSELKALLDMLMVQPIE